MEPPGTVVEVEGMLHKVVLAGCHGEQPLHHHHVGAGQVNISGHNHVCDGLRAFQQQL